MSLHHLQYLCVIHNFLLSSKSLFYVNIVCFHSIRKYTILIMLCILHCFQSLVKSFPWSPLQINFWNEFFFSHSHSSFFRSKFLLSTLAHIFSLLFVVASIFPLRRSFWLLFTIAPIFWLCWIFLVLFIAAPNFLPLICLLRKVSCCYLFLHTVQKLVFLFIVHKGFIIYYCAPKIDIYQHHGNSSK